MPPASTSLPFSACDEFTLGIAEELLMAAPGSVRPSAGTDAVPAMLDPAVGSVSDGVLELRAPARARVGEAIDVLRRLRSETGRHVPLLGAGLHPLGRLGDVRLR